MKTFIEKIFKAKVGEIVFREPDIVLSHDNTASIAKTFSSMGGEKVKYPDKLLIVLDHNAPPTTTKLANDYQFIKDFVKKQKINKFHREGDGICHQIMSEYAKPGMIIVGSDSHTATAGAFNAFSAGIDRTETAGLWIKGETWFRVPETYKITLNGKFQKGVYAKDLALWILGIISSSGANYMAIEFHGEGVKNLSISDRMTLSNLSAEMGAKSAAFPPDEILKDFIKDDLSGIWADEGAEYSKELTVNLDDIVPVTAAPHNVDNIKSISEITDISIQEAVIGTCTNGRIEDLRVAASILKNNKVFEDTLLIIIPASRKIYSQAAKEGLLEIFSNSGATVMVPSCGPCLGTGQALPADNWNIISTANRNFLGRMGNPKSNVYLASPAVVATSAIKGKITLPINFDLSKKSKFNYSIPQSKTTVIDVNDNRYENNVWNYSDVDNLNTDQMFSGSLTYQVKSSDPETILPHLFADLDKSFSKKLSKGDIIIGGNNFGCGSSREHPSVGLAFAGVKAVIVKSIARIFFRSAINQGLLIIVSKEAVKSYKKGNKVEIDSKEGIIIIENKAIKIPPLPVKLQEIIDAGGLKNYLKN